MSEDLKDFGYVIRIGVMAFVLPIWALTTGFFVWEGMYLYAAAMLFFGAIMGYGVYMNWKRLAGDERIDDERMQKINWKSGANAFWAVLNGAIVLWFFEDFLISTLRISETAFHRYDLAAVMGIGFLSYFAFRTYYLRTGVENEFWRLK